MLLLLSTLALGAAWIYLRFASAPAPPWTDFYNRALSKPQWSMPFPIGAAQDFVSWAGICPSVWAVKVEPSVNLVLACLNMRDAIGSLLPGFNSFAEDLSGLHLATMCVFYAHALAGVDMTQSEAAAHALMAFYAGDHVIKDANAAASDLAEVLRERLQIPLPPALLRYHHAQQGHFQVLLLPQPPALDTFLQKPDTNVSADARKKL